jgi:hypothetical protein
MRYVKRFTGPELENNLSAVPRDFLLINGFSMLGSLLLNFLKSIISVRFGVVVIVVF